jgi:hypothetical protein
MSEMDTGIVPEMSEQRGLSEMESGARFQQDKLLRNTPIVNQSQPVELPTYEGT